MQCGATGQRGLLPLSSGRQDKPTLAYRGGLVRCTRRCPADRLLLGLLRHGGSPAAALLRARGLDLDSARADLRRAGPAFGPGASPAAALRTLGIDADEVRQRLEASFGSDALHAAERRVRRRPRWRGGHPRPSPLCVYLLAKRAMEFAARFAAHRGDAGIGPRHLLYGVLQDARDPGPGGQAAPPPWTGMLAGMPEGRCPARESRWCPRTAMTAAADATMSSTAAATSTMRNRFRRA
jgi:hypothetical protein